MSNKSKHTFKVFGIAAAGCVAGSLLINSMIDVRNPSVDIDGQERLAALNEELASRDSVIEEKSAQIDVLEGEVTTLRSRMADLEDRSGASIAKIATLALENADLKSEIAGLGAVGSTSITPDLTTDEPGSTKVDHVTTYMENIAQARVVLGSMDAADMEVDTWSDIADKMVDMDRSVALYAGAPRDELDEDGIHDLETFKAVIESQQAAVYPVLRDAFGPAIRKTLDAGRFTAVTKGDDYRTVLFRSDEFSSMEAIQEFHASLHPDLVALRFSEAVYTSLDGSQIFGSVDFPEIADQAIYRYDTLN